MDDLDARVFERVWRGDAEGEAFHGPALARSLRSVEAAQAARRPSPGLHSIEEIVVHMVAWREWVLARLEGGPNVDLSDDGWIRVEGPDADRWAALRRRLTATEDAVLAHLRGPAKVPEDRRRTLLRFLLHHDLHHGGQIAMLAGPR